jgi:hypothetical protein
MHRLLCFKSKFPNHFAFTLGHYLFLLFEKKSMGGEMSFRPLVRPHRSLPFVTIVVCDLSCQKMKLTIVILISVCHKM